MLRQVALATMLVALPSVAEGQLGPSPASVAALARIAPRTNVAIARTESLRAQGEPVLGGAIAGAISGAVFGGIFALASDEDTGTKVGVGLGSIVAGAALGALLGLVVQAL